MTTRRTFIGTSLGTGALAATGCQTTGSAGKRRIVDAQIHLWQAPSAEWPWVPGMKPQMPEPFSIEKLVPMIDAAGVDRVVIVPPASLTGRCRTLRALRNIRTCRSSCRRHRAIRCSRIRLPT